MSSGEAASIGRYLADQRKLRGLSLEDVADRSKIPRRSLERLEAGAFDRDADGFARGFVRTVASTLGLDPDDAVTRLLAEPGLGEEEPAGAGVLFRSALALASAAALLALAVWLASALWSDGGESLPPTGAVGETPSEAPDDGLVYRTDAVRELAEEQAH